MREPVSLYLHIPFCIRKCNYCDFLSAPQPEEIRERYVRALLREIKAAAEALRPLTSGRPDKNSLPCISAPKAPGGASPKSEPRTPVGTVFFGGGTPSLLTAGQLRRIMEALFDRFAVLPDAEISMEANPGTVDEDSLRRYREAGINRLSIGVQSLDDGELRLLGRIHTAKEAREAFFSARKAGFDNISLDLMSALPGQTFESWSGTLREAASWEPEHISAYSLIIEPGTPFARWFEEEDPSGRGLPALPGEDEDRRMYHYTLQFLAERGYRRYEISNYARPGRECRHNIVYWTGRPYLGFGIGAASYMNGTRFSNISDLGKYLDILEAGDRGRRKPSAAAGPRTGAPVAALRTDVHILTEAERMEEFMFLGLRMTGGVRFRDFRERFGAELEEVYGGVLSRHLAGGVLERTPGGVRLTGRGLDISNYVLADYLF